MKIFAIQIGHFLTQIDAEQQARQQTGQHDHQRKPQIVQPDAQIGVAESLEQPDLRALHHHQARQHDVDQEYRYRQKDRRNIGCRNLDLAQLVGEKTVGQLVGTAIGAEPAIAQQQLIQAGDDLCFLGTLSPASATHR